MGRSPQFLAGQGGSRIVVLAGLSVVVFAVFLLLTPPMIATWVVLVGGMFFLALVAPVAALCLVPFAVAFGSLFALNVHGINIGPSDVLVAALTVSWLARAIATPRQRSLVSAGRTSPRAALAAAWQRDRLTVLVFGAFAAYLLIVLLSLLVATDRAATVKEVVKWTEVLVLLALTRHYLRDVGRVRLVVWSILVAGVAEALLGCAQWVLAEGSLGPGGASIRVFGTFGQPNPFGGYLNFALACALALLLFGEDARERWVAGAASSLLLIAQALANSRGAELGLLALVITLIVVGWRRERLAGLVALVGVPLIVLAWVTHLIPTSLQEKLLAQVRLNDVLSGQINDANFSTVERLAHWIAGLRMFAAHPFLGVGAGNYNAVYPAYALPNWPDSLGHAHNYYINVAAETGVLGLLVFLALVAASLAVGWRAAHPTSIPTGARFGLWPHLDARQALALGLFAALVALTIHNLTDDLFVHAIEQQFALTLGSLLALRSQNKLSG